MTEIASPCLKICLLDAQGNYCLGCYRTRAEVGAWLSMSDEERADIMAQLPARKDEINNPE